MSGFEARLRVVQDRDVDGNPLSNGGKPAPVAFYEDAAKKHLKGLLFEDPQDKRTYIRVSTRAPNQTVFGKDAQTGKETNVQVETLVRYCDGSGNIRDLPMRKDFGRMAEDERGEAYDFNIHEKGWTYATVKDHFTHRALAAKNRAEQEHNRKSRDPSRAEERLADAIVNASARKDAAAGGKKVGANV